MSDVEWTMKVAQTEPKEWRLAKALRMIQEGRWTIRRGASFAGLRYHDMLDRMSEAGVDSGPTLKELRGRLPLDPVKPAATVRGKYKGLLKTSIEEIEEAQERLIAAAVRKKIRELGVSREDILREVRAVRRERAKRSR